MVHAKSIRISARVRCLFCLLVAGLLAAPASAGIVIRAGECSADAFINGSGVLADGDNIQHLSVNCTDDTSDKKKYTLYLSGISQYNNFCVATTGAVQNAGGKLVKNKVPGNKNHCLLDGKASKLAGVLTAR